VLEAAHRLLPEREVTPATLDHAAIFRELFGFSRRNFSAYLGPKARLRVRANHIAAVSAAVSSFGFGVETPLVSVPQSWLAFLKGLRQSVREGPPQDGIAKEAPGDPAPTNVLPHPAWRVIPRPHVIDEVLGRLKRSGAVAIVGMSGSGKSILARQVLDRAGEQFGPCVIVRADNVLAPVFSISRQPGHADHASLASAILSSIAAVVRSRVAPNTGYAEALSHFSTAWPQPEGDDERRYDSQPAVRGLITAIGTAPKWSTFVRAVAQNANAVRNFALLTAVARILRLASEFVLHVDNLPDISRIREFTEFLAVLFGRAEPGHASAHRLLVTSLHRTALGFLNSPLAETSLQVSLDDARDAREAGFALRLVSAWAVPGELPVSREDAEQAITRFQQSRIDDSPKLREEINAVIERIRGHPLALAAIGSAWRFHHSGETSSLHFWGDVLAAIARRREGLLSFDPNIDYGDVVEPRQHDVLASLQFAWRSMEPDSRERYLDLVVGPPEAPINEPLMHRFWERTSRGGTLLGYAMPRHRRPLQQFASRSLLTPTDPILFSLHTLHRWMIEVELGADGITQRHRDLLVALRLDSLLGDSAVADIGGLFRSDEAVRTMLAPPLDDADDQEIREVGAYLTIHLPGHLRAAGLKSALSTCLTSLAYLQAVLDEGGDPADPFAGNVEAMLSVLRESEEPDITVLRDTVSAAAQALLANRLELGPQLVARVPDQVSPALDRLVADTKRDHRFAAIRPRFCFFGGPRRSFHHAGQLREACWVSYHGMPHVFAWSPELVQLWNPSSGATRVIARPEDERLAAALWLPGVEGHCVVLATDRGDIHLVDPTTLRRRRVLRLHLARDEGILSLGWVANAGGGPAITAITEHDLAIEDDGWTDTSAEDSRICLWSLATGRPSENWSKRSLNRRRLLRATWLDSVFGSPAVLVASQTEAYLLDATSGLKREWPGAGLSLAISGATWVPDAFGRSAVLGWSEDHELMLWDIERGVPMDIPQMIHDGVTDAEWIADPADEPRILTRSWMDGTVILWNARTGQILPRPPADLEVSRGVHWVQNMLGSPGILSWTDRGRVSLWPAGTYEKAIPAAGRLKRANALQWVEGNGQRPLLYQAPWTHLTDADGARVFSAETGVEEKIPPLPDSSVWTANHEPVNVGGIAAVLLRSGRELRLWRLLSGEFDPVVMLQSTPVIDARVIAQHSARPLILSWGDTTVRLWDGQRKQAIGAFKHPEPVSTANWISDWDGRSAVCTQSNRHIRLWREDGEPLQSLSRHDDVPDEGGLSGVRWFQFGQRCLVLARTRTLIHVWDGQTGEFLRAIASPRNDAGYRPSIDDAFWIADSGRPLVLAVVRGAIFMSDPFTRSDPLQGIIFERDPHSVQAFTDRVGGTFVVVASGSNVSLFSMTDGKLIQRPGLAHDGGVNGILPVSILGMSLILSWSSDGTIRVLRPVDGFQISRFTFDDEVAWLSPAPGPTPSSITFAAGSASGEFGVFDFGN
jgi:WD40 repeat protein